MILKLTWSGKMTLEIKRIFLMIKDFRIRNVFVVPSLIIFCFSIVFFAGNLVPTFLFVIALFGLVFLVFDCLATIQKIENKKK